MRKVLHLLLLAFLAPISSLAQTQPDTEVVRSDEQEFQLNEKASFHFQYLMDEFIPGTIFLKNKGPVETAINYNILMDAIQYYDQENNLLTMSKELAVDSVRLGPHLLVPVGDEGFMEMYHTGQGPLYLHRRISYYAEVLKKGPYGAIERTSAVDKVNTLNKSGFWGKDVVITNTPKDDIEVRMRYHQSYLFPAADGTMIELSSRKATSRAFPEHSNEISRFIRKHRIDFQTPEEMAELAGFLHSL